MRDIHRISVNCSGGTPIEELTKAHFHILRDGTTNAILPIEEVGEHTPGWDDVIIGVIVEGGESGNDYTPEQMNAVKTLFAEQRNIIKGLGIASWDCFTDKSNDDGMPLSDGGKPYVDFGALTADFADFQK